MNSHHDSNLTASSRLGVEKLARLVKGRQEASLEDIAKIIDNDVAVTGRLMAKAYPRAPARQEATVQMATSRVGINYVIVLYITDLLNQYVVEVFQDRAGIALTKQDASLVSLEERDYLVASVKFSGKATGSISLVFSSTMSLLIADRVLADGEELTLESINQAVCIMMNTIAAHMQAGLSEGKLPCTFEAAEIGQEGSFQKDPLPGGSNEEFFFRHGGQGLRVRLNVKPFSLG
jgi:hypothetical protein